MSFFSKKSEWEVGEDGQLRKRQKGKSFFDNANDLLRIPEKHRETAKLAGAVAFAATSTLGIFWGVDSYPVQTIVGGLGALLGAGVGTVLGQWQAKRTAVKKFPSVYKGVPFEHYPDKYRNIRERFFIAGMTTGFVLGGMYGQHSLEKRDQKLVMPLVNSFHVNAKDAVPGSHTVTWQQALTYCNQ